MRKVLLALLMLTSMATYAQGVSEEQARQTASRFIASKAQNGSLRMPAGQSSSLQLAWAPTYNSDKPEVYVFNLPNQGGFVIISGDESTPRQVLGWSDKGSFDPDKMPMGLRSLSGQYVAEIASMRQEMAKSGNARPRLPRAKTSGYGEVKPLLKTQWGQNYNNYLPEYPAGCTATAMAQIMNYHKWPKHGYGTHTNAVRPSQTVDFSQSTYNWSKMAQLYSGDNHEEAVDEISKLQYEIGCSLDMTYDYSGSAASSFNVFKALSTNFNYDEGKMHTYTNFFFDADMLHWDDWDNTLRTELKAHRPVYYAGNDTVWVEVWIDSHTHYKDMQYNVGHAFVCDGFSDDGLFHFNFGWDGNGDGYYSTKLIRPNGEDNWERSYAPINYMIVGIMPSEKEKIGVDGIWYDVDEETCTATLASCVDGVYEGDVVIPSEFEYEGKNYKVNAIHRYALKDRETSPATIDNLTFNAAIDEFPNILSRNRAHVKSLTFAGGTRRIAPDAFYMCEDLQEVTLAGDMEEIGDRAFYACLNLRSVTFGDKVKKIGKMAFNIDENLTTATFGAAIDSIGDQAFLECRNLANVEFPEGIRHIGEEAFKQCNLTTLTLPNSLLTLGKEAFAQNKGLWDLTLGTGLAEISDGAFGGGAFYYINVPANIKRIGKGAISGVLATVNFNGEIELDSCAITSSDLIYNLSGLEYCTRIAYNGIRGASGVFTPNPKAKYDRYALSGKFDKIIIPADFTDYNYTTALETKEFCVDPAHPTLASAGGALYTKDYKTLLALPLLNADGKIDNERVIPTGITTMSEQPLNASYRYLYLPPSLSSIQARSLYEGYTSNNVIYAMNPVPPVFTEYDGVNRTEWGYHDVLHVPAGSEEAYRNAPVWDQVPNIMADLEAVDAFIYKIDTTYDGLKYATVIGRNPLLFTGKEVVVPSIILVGDERIKVTNIDESVFQGDATVEKVTLGMFISNVYPRLFRNCENLKEVKIEGDIYDINDQAFENCVSLEQFIVPRTNSLHTIGKRAFAGCKNLKKVDITTDGEIYNFFEEAFEGCSSLRSVKGISEMYTLPGRTFANSGIETFHIGAGMNSFSYDNPFDGCQQLHSFTVSPENTKFFVVDGILYNQNPWSSYPWTLYICPPRQLKDGQVVDREVVNISERCDQLSNQFPATLREVVIPATMKAINSGTFSYTTNLEKITVLRTDPDFVTPYTFWSVYNKATLQVPKGKKEAYAAHEEWGKFANIVEIDPDDYPSPEAIQAAIEAEQNKPDDPDLGNALAILMQDDYVHFLRLDQQPVITFGNRNLNISGMDISLSLPIADIKYYYFDTYNFSGIAAAEDMRINLDFSDGDLNASGLQPGQQVRLFDIQGRLMRQATAAEDGTICIDIKSLPTAVYLLNVNETTYKILKK